MRSLGALKGSARAGGATVRLSGANGLSGAALEQLLFVSVPKLPFNTFWCVSGIFSEHSSIRFGQASGSRQHWNTLGASACQSLLRVGSWKHLCVLFKVWALGPSKWAPLRHQFGHHLERCVCGGAARMAVPLSPGKRNRHSHLQQYASEMEAARGHQRKERNG